MTDSKVRPAAEVAADLGRSRRLDVDSHAVSTLQRWSDAVRAEADAAGYQRAVRDCTDLCDQIACGSKLNTGERHIAGRCAELIRARFGDGSKGDD